jgi:hypothetical protein
MTVVVSMAFAVAVWATFMAIVSRTGACAITRWELAMARWRVALRGVRFALGAITLAISPAVRAMADFNRQLSGVTQSMHYMGRAMDISGIRVIVDDHMPNDRVFVIDTDAFTLPPDPWKDDT